MKIIISGASGLVGRRLLKALAGDGHQMHVLSRHAGTNLPPGIGLSVWDPLKGEPPADCLDGADAVIHLAGERVDQRWTPEAKQRIRDSRVTGTRNLALALARLARRPEVLICASATGFYGSRGDEILTETSAPGTGFLPELCQAWEQEARFLESLKMRVVLLRTGLALDNRGGALPRMLPPFRLGVGGRLGDGRQWVSWIHLQDLVRLIQFALRQPVEGPLNGVAPNPVTNSDFTRTLAAALKRPAILPAPRFALRMLLGEMSELLLASQRVLPQAPEEAGFKFNFPLLGPALADVLK